MNLDRIYKSKSQFVAREVDKELVLVPLTESVAHMNKLFTMNETGRFIWENISEGITVDELENIVVQEFEIDRETARKDIEAFLARLEQML